MQGGYGMMAVGLALNRTMFSVALVVVILAVTPWDYVLRNDVRAPGEPWR